MLSIRLTNDKQQHQLEHAEGPIEFGRGRPTPGGPRRFQIEDNFVSRDQLRLQETAEGLVRVENLSTKISVVLPDGTIIPPGGLRDLYPPLSLTAGRTLLEIEAGGSDSFDKDSLMTISQPVGLVQGLHGLRPLNDLGEAPSPEALAYWLEMVLALHRSTGASSELYEQTARALVQLLSLDVGLVLFRQGDGWEVAARHVRNDFASVYYSRSLLTYVVKEKRTFFQNLGSWKCQESLRDIDAVVISPILDLAGEVAGAVYGSRKQRLNARTEGIRPLEAQVVQILAAAVGANLIRANAVRTRVQFEQFFSPTLVRELERNPALLEGRGQDVTVLVSDLRGFTGLSERLGPQTTCALVRDLMERLSQQISDFGGVIVDYTGDGILAMWNAPVQQEDHALRACRAALAMLAEMPGLNAEWQQTVGSPLVLGIGINTGPAQVGNTGSSRKFKYGPLGHTVNLASRIQEATKRLELPLLITGPTQEQVRASFAVRRLCRVRVAGVTGPVLLYELHGENAVPEWTALRDCYEAAFALFEERRWAEACEKLRPLVEGDDTLGRCDNPVQRLWQRAKEYAAKPPAAFDPVVELSSR
jgi:adenylate cyclase